jgi:hypothetical protein
MPRAGFELTIPVTQRPKTYDLDRPTTGTGNLMVQTEAFKRKDVVLRF